MTHGIAPLEPPFTAEVAELLQAYPQRDGYLLKLFRVFAHSPRFLRRGTVNLLDRDSPLSLRERELVILRTTAQLRCVYEWGVHAAAFGAAAGLDDAALQALCRGDPQAATESHDERLLLRVVDALCVAGDLDDALLADFRVAFDVAQQLEVYALCGNYHTISFVANAARVPAEDFAVAFPSVPALTAQSSAMRAR